MGQPALLIADVQNDFCPGGALGVPRGDEIVPILNRYIQVFRERGLPIFVSRDWHPPKTTHFREWGGKWPPHCLQGTRGAEFHPDLQVPPDAIVVSKGANPEQDAYSVFQALGGRDRSFEEVLREKDVDRLFVAGLATDYCVLSSVLDARTRRIDVVVLTDAVRPIDVKPGDGEKALRAMTEAGAQSISIERIDQVLSGKT